MFRIAVLVSGGGTNLQNIIDKIKENYFSEEIEISAVIADRICHGVERAKKEKIDYFILDRKKQGANLSKELDKVLREKSVDLIVLAGFLSILSEEFVKNWDKKIINIHPSLLPKFGGRGMYGLNVHRAVIDSQEKESGCTVHYVDSSIDGGEIIRQKKVKVFEDDTPEILQQRILKEEYNLLSEGIEEILKKRRER